MTPLWWGVAGGTLTGALGAALVRKYWNESVRFKALTLDGVMTCWQRPDEALIQRLLDPDDREAQFIARKIGNYRHNQRSRLNDLREHYDRTYHNGLLLKHWGDTIWFDIFDCHLECDDEVLEYLTELRAKATEFCRASQLARRRIWYWSLIPFDRITVIPIPSLTKLRESQGLDLPSAYEALKTIAIQFVSRGHSVEIAQQFAQELGVAWRIAVKKTVVIRMPQP
jgi:hypothetical protein